MRDTVALLVRWGTTVGLSIAGGYVVRYAGLCRVLGSGLDACSYTNNSLEIYVIAALLMLLAVVSRW